MGLGKTIQVLGALLQWLLVLTLLLYFASYTMDLVRFLDNRNSTRDIGADLLPERDMEIASAAQDLAEMND